MVLYEAIESSLFSDSVAGEKKASKSPHRLQVQHHHQESTINNALSVLHYFASVLEVCLFGRFYI